LKHLQSLPELQDEQTSKLSLLDRSQRVLDAIHEFGKGENRYLMSVGETKGKQVEELVRQKKPKVSISSPHWNSLADCECSSCWSLEHMSVTRASRSLG
jgi:hypothetical protein